MRVRFSRRDLLDLSRSLGGVMLALGAVVLLSRGEHHGWGHLVRLLILLVPAAILYLLSLRRPKHTNGSEPSRSVLGVTAILLGPLVLIELLHWAGTNTGRPLVEAGIFTVTALIAGYAAIAARIAYAALLAGISALLAWLLVWGQILDHPSTDTYRGLLVAAAVLLLLIAAMLAARDAIGAGELATAGGLAAVVAGIIGVVVGSFLGTFGRLFGSVEGSSSSGPSMASAPTSLHASHGDNALHTLTSHASGLQHFGWDLYLLVVSLALVWIGSRMRVRGLGYVGGAGLLAFLVSVGAQVTRIEAGHAPSSSIVGWPLALLILGLAGLLAPAVLRQDES